MNYVLTLSLSLSHTHTHTHTHKTHKTHTQNTHSHTHTHTHTVQECEGYECPTSNRLCIPKSWLCDGTSDCEHGHDEIQDCCKFRVCERGRGTGREREGLREER